MLKLWPFDLSFHDKIEIKLRNLPDPNPNYPDLSPEPLFEDEKLLNCHVCHVDLSEADKFAVYRTTNEKFSAIGRVCNSCAMEKLDEHMGGDENKVRAVINAISTPKTTTKAPYSDSVIVVIKRRLKEMEPVLARVTEASDLINEFRLIETGKKPLTEDVARSISEGVKKKILLLVVSRAVILLQKNSDKQTLIGNLSRLEDSEKAAILVAIGDYVSASEVMSSMFGGGIGVSFGGSGSSGGWGISPSLVKSQHESMLENNNLKRNHLRIVKENFDNLIRELKGKVKNIIQNPVTKVYFLNLLDNVTVKKDVIANESGSIKETKNGAALYTQNKELASVLSDALGLKVLDQITLAKDKERAAELKESRRIHLAERRAKYKEKMAPIKEEKWKRKEALNKKKAEEDRIYYKEERKRKEREREARREAYEKVTKERELKRKVKEEARQRKAAIKENAAAVWTDRAAELNANTKKVAEDFIEAGLVGVKIDNNRAFFNFARIGKTKLNEYKKLFNECQSSPTGYSICFCNPSKIKPLLNELADVIK